MMNYQNLRWPQLNDRTGSEADTDSRSIFDRYLDISGDESDGVNPEDELRTVLSMYYHCTINVLSLYYHCTITVLSLYYHCTITVLSMLDYALLPEFDFCKKEKVSVNATCKV